MNKYNFIEYKQKINENINLTISKYYKNNIQLKKNLNKLRKIKNMNIEQKFITNLQEQILLLNYNKNVLIKNIKLFVDFVNELEIIKKVTFDDLTTSESDVEINEDEEEMKIKNIIEGIKDLFLSEKHKINFFNFIDNFNKEDEHKKTELKQAFNELMEKDLNIVTFFKPTETTNHNNIFDDVEMNISSSESEHEGTPPTPHCEPEEKTPSQDVEKPKPKRIISIEQRMKQNARRREIRAMNREKKVIP